MSKPDSAEWNQAVTELTNEVMDLREKLGAAEARASDHDCRIDLIAEQRDAAQGEAAMAKRLRREHETRCKQFHCNKSERAQAEKILWLIIARQTTLDQTEYKWDDLLRWRITQARAILESREA